MLWRVVLRAKTPGNAMFTAYGNKRGTRGQLVEGTIEGQLTKVLWRLPGWSAILAQSGHSSAQRIEEAT
jgi:hypothetical protein